MVWNSEKTTHEELVPETAVKETHGLTREGDTLGYARISTVGQDAAGQQERLLELAPSECSPT